MMDRVIKVEFRDELKQEGVLEKVKRIHVRRKVRKRCPGRLVKESA